MLLYTSKEAVLTRATYLMHKRIAIRKADKAALKSGAWDEQWLPRITQRHHMLQNACVEMDLLISHMHRLLSGNHINRQLYIDRLSSTF